MKCFENQLCVDCGVDTFETKEYYMVTDSCWKRAGMKPYGGMLCVGCIESRLGKKLTPQNFSECPLNWRNAIIPDYASGRLLARLYHGRQKSKWARGAIAAMEDILLGKTEDVESKILMNIG